MRSHVPSPAPAVVASAPVVLAVVSPAAATPLRLDQPPGPLLSIAAAVEGWLHALRDALALVVEACLGAPRAVPAALVEIAGDRPLALSGALCGMVLAGWVGERLFRHWAGPWERLLDANPLLTARARALVQAERFAYAHLLVFCFTAGIVAAELLLAPPGRAGLLLLDVLLGVVCVRFVLAFGRFLIAPGGPRYRPASLTTEAARVAFGWLRGFCLAGWAGVEGSAVLRLGGEDRLADGLLSATALLLALLLPFAFVRTFRRDGRPSNLPRASRPIVKALAPLAWLFAATGFDRAAWTTLALALAPPLALSLAGIARWIVYGAARDEAPSAGERLVLRAARDGALATALLIVLAVATEPGGRSSMWGLVEAAAVLLIADMAWCVMRGLIDHRLAEAAVHAEERLTTVLPALRSIGFVMIALVTGFGLTSALGLQLGPLIAGAGVVGLAIGIGAQALVRDVVAGLFLLVEDAFRVGETVESGNLMGTVESFSLRSVRLRDDAGRLHTVAFGELKSLTNVSRDWAGMEVPVYVGQGTPLEAVERVVVEAIAALEADETLAATLLQRPRFLGATSVSETSIKLVVLLKTVPGRQFAARSALLRLVLLGMARAGLPVGIEPLLRERGARQLEALPRGS